MARQLLGAHTDGDLYVAPQLEGQRPWSPKPHGPHLYLRMASAGARHMPG